MNDHDKLRALEVAVQAAAKRLRLPGVEGVAAGPKCADELQAALAALGGKGEAVDPTGKIAVLLAEKGADESATQPEAQGEAVDVTGFGTPPLFHEERKDAEQAYTVTAFDYPKAPVGSRDWMLYWRGWWHRSLVYGDTAAPKPVEGVTEAAVARVLDVFEARLMELWGTTENPHAEAYGWLRGHFSTLTAANKGAADGR